MSEPDLSEPRVSGLRFWDRGRLPPVPRWVGLLALVVVVLGVGGWAIGEAVSSSGHTSKRSRSPTANYIKFKDPAGTFEGAYPPNWKSVPTTGPQFVVLAEGPNGASYEVGKTTLTAPVTASNLAAAEALTDRIVKKGLDFKLIRKPIEIKMNGLPGFLYLYTFKDPATGQTGAHAHYFVFDGKELITLVFQSLPANNFVSLAPLFDRIVSTFHVLATSSR